MSSLDYYTLAALTEELMDTVVGGRVQDSVVVDSTALGLEIYANHRRHYLYLSADKQHPRVHLVEAKLRRGVQRPTQLALLTRRFVEGGLLTHVHQPAWERILHLEFEGPEGAVTLIAEPMERRSNLILVRDGIVMDAARRVSNRDNRMRVTLPAQPYEPPPPLVGRYDPARVTLDELHAVFAQVSDPERTTAQTLSARMYGVSPVLAREVVFRAGAPKDQPAQVADVPALFAALQAVVGPLGRREWQPGVARDDDGRALAFSVYPLQHIPGWEPVETVSRALVAYYGQAAGPDGYKVAKREVHAVIEDARGKLRGRLASLESGLRDDDQLEQLRQSGELILAYQYTLQPKQPALRAQYDPEGPELDIRLDPALSPLENAQAYFHRYEKAKRAREGVPALVAEVQGELDFLDALETDLTLAGNWPEIDEVRQQLRVRGLWQGEPPKKMAGGQAQSAPLRVVTRDGFVLWVGRNSRQNEQVTFGRGGGDDLWLHARGVPGAHVVIKFDGRPIPEDVILQAAAIAAHYSANREEGSVVVDVTPVKHVKKIKGAAPGMVTYRNETTRTVAPADEETFDTP